MTLLQTWACRYVSLCSSMSTGDWDFFWAHGRRRGFGHYPPPSTLSARANTSWSQKTLLFRANLSLSPYKSRAEDPPIHPRQGALRRLQRRVGVVDQQEGPGKLYTCICTKVHTDIRISMQAVSESPCTFFIQFVSCCFSGHIFFRAIPLSQFYLLWWACLLPQS